MDKNRMCDLLPNFNFFILSLQEERLIAAVIDPGYRLHIMQL